MLEFDKVPDFYYFWVLGLYMHPVTETQLRVDTTRGEKLRINVKSFN